MTTSLRGSRSGESHCYAQDCMRFLSGGVIIGLNHLAFQKGTDVLDRVIAAIVIGVLIAEVTQPKIESLGACAQDITAITKIWIPGEEGALMGYTCLAAFRYFRTRCPRNENPHLFEDGSLLMGSQIKKERMLSYAIRTTLFVLSAYLFKTVVESAHVD